MQTAPPPFCMKDGGAVIIFALFYSYIWSGTSGTNINDNDPAFFTDSPLALFYHARAALSTFSCEMSAHHV